MTASNDKAMTYLIPVDKTKENMKQDGRSFIIATSNNPNKSNFLAGVYDYHQPSIFLTPESPYSEYTNHNNFKFDLFLEDGTVIDPKSLY
jgi:hypothetical protein